MEGPPHAIFLQLRINLKESDKCGFSELETETITGLSF